jgi:hypothetical protein
MRCAAVLAVLAALPVTGCGTDKAIDLVPDTGPFDASLQSVAGAIREAKVPATVERRPAALARLSQPGDIRSASLRSARGSTFDLLVYRSPQVALRAGASIRQAAAPGSELTFSHNVILVMHHRRADSFRIRRAVLKVGANGIAPG